MLSMRKYLTAGLLAAVPLWVTWLVIAFVLGIAVDLAGPLTRWLVSWVGPSVPGAVHVLGSSVAQYTLSVLLMFAILYCLGWLTTHFVGRRLIKGADRLLLRIPLVGRIYGGTKQVVEAFQTRPGQGKQVVLIDYPHPGMKTVGLVTKTLSERTSQEPLLAVYVPTTPNPTSGFLEIVPARDVTPTDWSVNDAIAFVVSGGSVGPAVIDYRKSPAGEIDGTLSGG
jgi:uncharacterized membrane protein